MYGSDSITPSQQLEMPEEVEARFILAIGNEARFILAIGNVAFHPRNWKCQRRLKRVSSSRTFLAQWPYRKTSPHDKRSQQQQDNRRSYAGHLVSTYMQDCGTNHRQYQPNRRHRS